MKLKKKYLPILDDFVQTLKEIKIYFHKKNNPKKEYDPDTFDFNYKNIVGNDPIDEGSLKICLENDLEFLAAVLFERYRPYLNSSAKLQIIMDNDNRKFGWGTKGLK